MSMLIFIIKRIVEFFFQRRIRGFDDSDTWSLDVTLSRWIVPRLKRFKEVKMGIPGFDHIDHENNFDEAEKYWDECLDKMIEAFEIIAYDEGDWVYSEVNRNKIDEGLDLFRKYFLNLWW